MSVFSEQDMANAFEKSLIEESIVRLPKFDFSFREVTCQQGIADFVCVNSNGLLEEYKFNKMSSIENSSQILALLKINVGRKFDYLIKQTGMSEISLNRHLKEMINKGYVNEINQKFYRCIPDISSNVNIWAFELKLTNWKRAIFQALQYKAFANYSAVVFPFDKSNVLQKNLHFFKELNIGILLYDANTNKNKWLYYPKKERPISKWHSFFLLGRITNQASDDNVLTDEL